MKKNIKILFIIAVITCLLLCLSGCKKNEKDEKLKIVTSFYPIYIMTSNITKDVPGVELSNMAETNVGCIHNYTLKPVDLKKMEKANIFIENGLGIESFNDKLINSFKNLDIIDSSKNINAISDNGEINGHSWTSIKNYINQIEEITEKLKEKNPENGNIYTKNLEEYKNKLISLENKYDNNLSKLRNKKVVVLNEAFEYLLRDLEIETIDIHTDHEESTISAEKLKDIINEMKENYINIIIIDKSDNEKNAETIKKETGAEILKLNSCLNGNLDNDAYINAMEENLNILSNI